MRTAVLLVLLPLMLFAQGVVETRNAAGMPVQPKGQVASLTETKPEDLGSLEGQVLNAFTGEPIRKAAVVLRRVDSTATSTLSGYSTATDDAGKLAMKDIEPGTYRMTVNRTGYVNGEYGAPGPGRQGATLTLGRAQKVGDLVVKLTPHGVVTGRVVDRDGDPVSNVQVQLVRSAQGRRQLTLSGAGSTNDLGEYRIFGVAPGRYLLSATYRRTPLVEATLDRSATPQGQEDFVPVYYPGTPDVSTAGELNVTAGGQVRADLTLVKARTVRISGRVISAIGDLAPAIPMVTLTPRSGFGGPLSNRSSAGGRDGKFELAGITPGSYFLISVVNQKRKSYSARVPVEVSSSNIDNVMLTIGGGLEVNGHLQIDGNSSVRLTSIRVNMEPREFGIIFGPLPNTSVKDDGTFKLEEVSPDVYNFFFPGLPDGFYVKSVRSGDTDVLATGLDLINGAPVNVDIVLSPNAGQVSGTVQSPKTQQPVPGATVVLVPIERERVDQLTYYKTASTDQSGSFTIKNVAPGEYKAYAWDDVESGAYYDPGFVKQFESKGKPVSLRESAKLTLQLTSIPLDGASSR